MTERVKGRYNWSVHVSDGLPRAICAASAPHPSSCPTSAWCPRPEAAVWAETTFATLISFAVARTITRPLAAITDVMREVDATGDLTRKIVVGEGRRWHDEDAQLLATTFNTLTDSVARFQREMSQKERLTSLGRLATVIARWTGATSSSSRAAS